MKALLLIPLAVGLSGSALAQGPAGGMIEGVKAQRDLAYVERGHDRQKLDLYVPEKGTGPFPLIVWIHGGGWAAGDKGGCPPLRDGFTGRGYAVASLNYRLSGDAVFPAQIEDCKAAIRWLRAHAKEYRLDPAHFGVWGSSAGGHLVALLGAAGGMREFDVGANLEQSSRVQAVCDYYGPTDLLQMDAHAPAGARMKHDSATSPESRLVGGAIQENREKAARLSPLAYLTKEAPPYLIVHGDQDGTVPHHQSELLFEALGKLGVPVRFITVEGGGHGQGFPGGELNQVVSEFFDRHLMGNPGSANWPAVMRSSVKAVPAPDPENRRGFAVPGRMPQGNGARPGISFDRILAREDANQDGRISREEFKGPPPLFGKWDRDGDGVLTRNDFEAAPPP